MVRVGVVWSRCTRVGNGLPSVPMSCAPMKPLVWQLCRTLDIDDGAG
jgi:hypothetical protein